MIAESGRLSQSVRYEDCKARVELLCRALESLSVADDGVFYDSAGDDESDRPPWTVRRIIERGPGSRVDDGPLDADIVVRKTGLLTAGRNPGDRTDPVRQPLTTEGNNVAFEGQLLPVRWTVAQALSPGRVFSCLNVHNDHWRETPVFRQWRSQRGHRVRVPPSATNRDHRVPPAG